MSEIITFPQPSGPNFHIPDVGELNWGQEVTNFLVAIPGGVPPTAGTFSLTGDLSFGPTFGLVTAYFKSISANIASTGSFRLSHSDSIAFRNNANSGDLLLAVDSSDNITFNGSTFGVGGAVNPGLAHQLAYYATSTNAVSGLTLITPNRALISDTNGLPVASTVTNTTLAFLDATSSVQTQLNSISTVANAALPKAGGTMSGNINMGGGNITNMAAGVNPSDAATLSQVTAVSFQPGDMKAVAYSSVPTGWLLCNGAAVNRITFSALFSAIGTAYGSGDGSTTFNIPNMVNNVPVGQGGSIAPSLGSTSGSTTHTLTVSELPSNIPVTITDPGHNHNLQTDTTSGTNSNLAHVDRGVTTNTPFPMVASHTTGITAVANGSDGAHSIVQPSIGINWLIKT